MTLSVGRRALGGAVSACLLWPALSSASGPDGLVLSVEAEQARALRCVMVMAHFMSAELGEVVPGMPLDIGLQRDASQGTLFVLSDDGRRQMVENIICGAADDWSATRSDLALQDLRHATETHAVFRCRIEGRVQCILVDGGD